MIRFTSVVLVLLFTSVCNAKDGAKADAKDKSETPPPRINSKVDVGPAVKLTPAESREVSFAAGRILKHVAQARRAIALKQHDQAETDVDQALKLAGIIESVIPKYKLKTKIKSGKLTYTDEEFITPEYITLFDELVRQDIIAPVLQAKNEGKQKSGKKSKSGNVPLEVREADLDYTTVKLDFNLTRQALDVAKSELAKKDHSEHEKADAALQTLQTSGVIFEYVEVDLPLEQADDNLRLAEIEMTAGNHEAAKSALYRASDELK